MTSRNLLSKLAGETAIYGMSTIVARIVNFFFVPLYSRVLSPHDYGIAAVFMAYIAILQVVLTYGMETTSFRFASKETQSPQKVFSTSLGMITLSSLFFLGLCYAFRAHIVGWFGTDNTMALMYMSLILVMDVIGSIVFAYLRFEHKALHFAGIKTAKILAELVFNVLLFLYLPSYLAHHSDSFLLTFLPARPDYTYMLFSILMSCILCTVLLIPYFIRIRFKVSADLVKPMLFYALPLLIAGIPGVANDFIDRLLFQYCSPTEVSWQTSLGLFQANVKLAVLMTLFVQMFRYAAEPFFFSQSKQKDSHVLYALVMKYFVLFCMGIFLLISVNLDYIGYILGKDYRQGLSIVPIMLIANMLLGISFNLSFWYKLSGQTRMAVWITLSGLAVTLGVNLIFMPLFGYHAAAWAHLMSYLCMVIVSYLLSLKYYPIQYEWKRIGGYIVLGIGLYFVSVWAEFSARTAEFLFNNALFVIYILFIVYFEKLWKIIPYRLWK